MTDNHDEKTEMEKMAMAASFKDTFTVTLSREAYYFFRGPAGLKIRSELGDSNKVRGSFLWSQKNPEECLMVATKDGIEYPGSPLMCKATLRDSIQGNWQSKIFAYVGSEELPALAEVTYFLCTIGARSLDGKKKAGVSKELSPKGFAIREEKK
jgi:hypothetical protein